MKKRETGNGMHLLRQGKSGVLRVVFSRLGIISVLFLLQAAILILTIVRLEEYMHFYLGGTAVITVIVVLFLLNSNMDPSAKITWLVMIMLMPVMNALLFLYTKSELGNRTLRKRASKLFGETNDRLQQFAPLEQRAIEYNEPIAGYLKNTCGFIPYNDSEITYYSGGEEKFEALKEAILSAEKYIFLEYFIIGEGEMWGNILNILSNKAKDGVEVRVMYDGTCQFTTLTADYAKRMKKLGIECRAFSPLTPFVSTYYNYRDHRKIAVIDGKTAFTGGVNLSDEYINIGSRFGHWKDAAVRIRGNAVNSFTLMFLQMWELEASMKPDYAKYLCRVDAEYEGCGIVIPYGDSPLDSNKTGERVYMDMLNRAREHVYIMTPYLILDSTMETALRFAAERGVDVRIVLPGIPDKKSAYALAKTHYKSLLSSGVKIYEYTPGFVHSKVVLADGHEAAVGTINLDYRSFYHHFECAAYMKGGKAIDTIRADFEDTFEKCRRVTEETVKKEKASVKLYGFLLKVIAPLM